jgi:putative membrane protein
MRRAGIYILAAGLMTMTAGPVMAQTAAKTAQVSAADKTFASEAAIGGMTEVALGQLAVQKASSADVKQFGQQMVTDHTQANQELMALAKQHGMVLPTTIDAKHQAMVEKMKGLNGAAFDSAYVKEMVQDHEKDVAAFQKQASSGTDPALKAFAQKYLPILQKHKDMVKALSAKA